MTWSQWAAAIIFVTLVAVLTFLVAGEAFAWLRLFIK